jgi:N-acetylmuramoyl-L-alanine amidase
LYEQDLTYEIGILLAELLSKDGRFEVRLSRPTADTILGVYNGSVSEANDSALDARINDAAAWGADYFISLHINAAESTTARGIEVYTANGDDVGYALGEDILDQLVKSTEMRNRGMKNGSHLRVLKLATMPAALLEMGFISNAEDAKLLDESPELFAQGVYNGIVAYFASLREKTE